ncbi:MAG: hypothetical protein H6625_04120 [Bdellovibrionaceae bacterium]|nr:hypothetical protein [Pseudobdellovibrionaceae bacterium]
MAFSQDAFEKVYYNIVQQLTQQFWSEMQLKLSLLPNNYITINNKQEREFIGKTGCPDRTSKNDSRLTYVEFSTESTKNNTSYEFTYEGCREKVIFQEIIKLQNNSKNRDLDIGQLLNGERQFIATTDFPHIVHEFFDNAGKSLIRIESEINNSELSTRFFALDILILYSVASRKNNSIQVSVYSYNIEYKSPFGSQLKSEVSHSVNPVIHQIEFLSPDIKKFSFISSQYIEQSERSFFNYLSLVALTDVKNVMGSLTNMLVSQFPETSNASSGLANKRLLNELVVLEQRLNVASPADLNYVKTMLKSYISSINNGTLTIIDKRPE